MPCLCNLIFAGIIKCFKLIMNELTKTYPRFRRQKYNFFPKPQAFGLKKVFSFNLTIGFFSNRYADDVDVALRERDGDAILVQGIVDYFFGFVDVSNPLRS